MTSENWARNFAYRAPNLRTPNSLDELQEIVEDGASLKALGSRHSFNDIADTSDQQVSLANLPMDLQIDRAARTATVGGGARYGEFVEQLNAAGWAIHNLASLPHISVAGAVATGTHGSGDRNGNLSTAVAAIEIVTADGEVRGAKRGDSDFNGMVVGLGAVGIVTRVTLDIEPTFNVRQDVFGTLGWKPLTEHFDEITSSAYSVSIFTRWEESGATQIWLKSRVDDVRGAAVPRELFGAPRFEHNVHPLTTVPSDTTTEQVGVAGPWWNRLAHFKLEFTPSHGAELQSEYLVAREHALAAIDAMRALGPQVEPHLFVSEIRTMAADSLWLSPSFGHDSVALHFTWKQHDAVYALLPIIEAALAPFAARPHWGKLFTTDAATLETLYPRIADFRDLASRLDPEHKFRNDYLRRTVFAS